MHLKAWIKKTPEGFAAYFVAVQSERQPAGREFKDARAAKSWIEEEASAIHAHVEWLVPPSEAPSLPGGG